MMVGTKAIATLSTGYLNALEYAKTRVQGADMTADDRQDRAARHDHPPPRRAPDADDAEVVRRGPARAVPVYRGASGPVGGRDRRPGPTPSSAERVNDLLLPIVKGVGSERAYECLTESLQTLRRLGLPAGLSDRAVHPRRQDRLASTRAPPRSRRRTSSSARSPATRASRWRTSSRRSRSSSTATSAQARAGRRPRAAGDGARRHAGDDRHDDRLPDDRPGGTRASCIGSAWSRWRSCWRSVTC